MSSSDLGAAENPATSRRGAPNRWLILGAAILVQLALGGVYAWSVFSKALLVSDTFNWSPSQTALPFTVCIGMIFIGSFLGGRLQDRQGPRIVALVGGVIYGLGVILASFARSDDALWLLVLGYGVLGGLGLGIAYIVPIALLQKWFPDKAGLITGIAVGGFGFGAVITAPVGQALIATDPDMPTRAFLPLGIGYLVASVLGAWFFRNPPLGYTVPGAPRTKVSPSTGHRPRDRGYTVGEALRAPQWYLLTAIFTLSVIAGISFVSVAAGSAADIAGFSAAAAASLVGILGLFNGGGRIFWGWFSDRIGKLPSLAAILAIQGISLLILPHASSAILFVILAALIYSCYGGAFGAMPSTAGRYFGMANAGAIYGLMLVAWSIGGVVGPTVLTRLIGDGQAYTLAFTVVGIVALAGIVLTIIARPPKERGRVSAPAAQ